MTHFMSDIKMYAGDRWAVLVTQIFLHFSVATFYSNHSVESKKKTNFSRCLDEDFLNYGRGNMKLIRETPNAIGV